MTQVAKVQLRIPEELRVQVVNWSKQNKRSMNSQILITLENAMKLEKETSPPTLPTKATGE